MGRAHKSCLGSICLAAEQKGGHPIAKRAGGGTDPFRNMAKKKLCKVEAKTLLKLLENLVLTGGANQLHASSCKAGHSGIIIKVI